MSIPPPVRERGSLDARVAALGGLVDYAGLFPPANLDLPAAVAEYQRLQASSEWWFVHRFVIPASRLADLGEVDFPLSVVAGNDHGALATRAAAVAERIDGIPPHKRAELVELRAAPAAPLLADVAGAATVLGGRLLLEVPADFEPWLAAAAEAREQTGAWLGAKLRCGGLTADAFPPPARVAAFVVRCRELGIPYKLTAGLHHPVRHDDLATGFTHHGFLNVLAAEVLGRDHLLPVDEVATIVAERDPAAFDLDEERLAWRGLSSRTEAILESRRLGFLAYGSCDAAEPLADLTAMGVLPLDTGAL